MPSPRKKSARTPQVRTGGAVGDTAMDDQLAYNEAGAGVDESRVYNCPDGDPNSHLTIKRRKGSEA